MVSLQDVFTRLGQLGYDVPAGENSAVQFELDWVLDYTVNYCNFSSRDEIPNLLDKRIIDRVCGEYLFKQQKAGNLEGFDYSAFVKTIKEGDTQIQFAGSADGETPESRFIDLCNRLERGFNKVLTPHRRIRW